MSIRKEYEWRRKEKKDEEGQKVALEIEWKDIISIGDCVKTQLRCSC